MKEYKYRLLFFLLCCLFVSAKKAFAQNTFTTDTYTTAFGLPSNDVQACTMDSTGFLWVATKQGLCRFDGYNFEEYPALKGYIVSIENRNNKSFLFYNSISGLHTFNPYTKAAKNLIPTKFSDSDPFNDHFSSLFEDNTGKIWCTDFSYVKYYDPAKKNLKTFSITPSMSFTDRIATFTQPSPDSIWAASLFGLFIFDGISGKLLPADNPALRSMKYTASAIVGRDSLLLAGDNVVLIVEPSSQKIISRVNIDRSETVTAVCTTILNGKKKILIASQNKISALGNESQLPETIYSSGPYDGNINSVFCEPDNGHIWISTSQGLLKLTEPSNAVRNIHLPLAKSIGENIITSVIKINSAPGYYVTTTKGDCYSFDLASSLKSIPIKNVSCIAQKGNLLLAASSNILFTYDGSTAKPVFKASPEGSEIKKILITDKYIWLLFRTKRPVILNKNDFTETTDLTVKENIVFEKNNLWNDIAEDSKGQIFLAGWMPADYGIAVYDPKENAFLPVSSKTKDQSLFNGDFYNRIAVSKKFYLLFSGYGGFNMVNEKGIVTNLISMNDHAIANEHIEGILELPDGKIWFGTEEGVQVWNPATDQTTLVSTQNGLPSNNATNGFNIIDSNIIAIGFNKTLSLLYTDKIFETILKNKLALTSVKVNGTEKDIRENELLLAPDERDLVISFSALNFSDAKKIQYQYRINNGVWQSLGHTPVITFSNFKPGKYIIEARVSDNSDTWQQKQLRLEIKAKPHFTETIWPVLLIIICAAALVWFLFYYRLKQLRRITQFRSVISQDLHDDVGATLSSINILSSMLAERTDLPAKPRSYLKRITTDVQQLQLTLDEIIWSLKKEQNTLQQIFSKLVSYGSYILEAKNISFVHRARLPASGLSVSMQKRRAIFLLVKEALNNIAKHSNATEATLNFEVQNNRLIVSVSDNGTGIDLTGKEHRNGISGMRKRAAEIKAELTVESFLNSGTKITVSLKLP